MKPVRTSRSNFVYKGPPGVRDLHCERRDGLVYSTWQLTAAERRAIADGANLELVLYIEPIQPVGLGLSFDQGIGEDAPAVLERLEFLRSAGRVAG